MFLCFLKFLPPDLNKSWSQKSQIFIILKTWTDLTGLVCYRHERSYKRIWTKGQFFTFNEYIAEEKSQKSLTRVMGHLVIRPFDYRMHERPRNVSISAYSNRNCQNWIFDASLLIHNLQWYNYSLYLLNKKGQTWYI